MKKGTRNNHNNNSNKKKKRNIRGRQAIGNTGAIEAIRNWDRQQEAREAYIRASEEYNRKLASGDVKYPCTAPIPSVEEIEKHWKQDPDHPGRLLCNKDGNKWRIVLTLEETYDTAVREIQSREWKSFEQFKIYMMEKYYIDEHVLDCLIKKSGEGENGDE